MHPFLISFLISLMIGIERERAHGEGQNPFGVRTFILIGLLGTLAASLNSSALLWVISLFTLGGILGSYLLSLNKKTRAKDIGFTTEASAAVTYLLGYMSPQDPQLCLILGIIMTALLFSKRWLHHFSKDVLKATEIQALLTVLVFIIGIMPFLPNKSYDPYGIFNPYQFGRLFAILACLQFSAYVLLRLFGQKGFLIKGFLGGIVSSTAVFIQTPKELSAHPSHGHSLMAAAFMSICGTLTLLLILIIGTAPKLTTNVGLTLIILSVFSLIIGRFYFKSNGHISRVDPGSPLEVKSLIKMTLLLVSMISLVTIVKRFLNAEALNGLSFLAGLFELQSMSLALLQNFNSQQIEMADVVINLHLTIAGSFFSKAIIILFSDRSSWRWNLTGKMLLFFILTLGLGGLSLKMLL